METGFVKHGLEDYKSGGKFCPLPVSCRAHALQWSGFALALIDRTGSLGTGSCTSVVHEGNPLSLTPKWNNNENNASPSSRTTVISCDRLSHASHAPSPPPLSQVLPSVRGRLPGPRTHAYHKEGVALHTSRPSKQRLWLKTVCTTMPSSHVVHQCFQSHTMEGAGDVHPLLPQA